jgi:hypothetical protein
MPDPAKPHRALVTIGCVTCGVPLSTVLVASEVPLVDGDDTGRLDEAVTTMRERGHVPVFCEACKARRN